MKIIGIDPAFRKQGFAVCILDVLEKTATFKVLKNGLLEFEDFVKENLNCYFAVENSNLQKSFFGKRKLAEAGAVGKNQAVSQLTVGFILKHIRKEKVHDISPASKGAKITNEAIFAAYMKEFSLIGYNGSQDEKDAAKIAIIGNMRQNIRNLTIREPEHLKYKKTRLVKNKR